MNVCTFLIWFSALLPLNSEANGNAIMGEISKFSRQKLAYEVKNFTGSKPDLVLILLLVPFANRPLNYFVCIRILLRLLTH